MVNYVCMWYHSGPHWEKLRQPNSQRGSYPIPLSNLCNFILVRMTLTIDLAKREYFL